MLIASSYNPSKLKQNNRHFSNDISKSILVNALHNIKKDTPYITPQWYVMFCMSPKSRLEFNLSPKLNIDIAEFSLT